MVRYKKIKFVAEKIAEYYKGKIHSKGFLEKETHYRVLEEVITEANKDSVTMYDIVVHLDVKHNYPIHHGNLLVYLQSSYNKFMGNYWGDIKSNATDPAFFNHYAKPSQKSIKVEDVSKGIMGDLYKQGAGVGINLGSLNIKMLENFRKMSLSDFKKENPGSSATDCSICNLEKGMGGGISRGRHTILSNNYIGRMSPLPDPPLAESVGTIAWMRKKLKEEDDDKIRKNYKGLYFGLLYNNEEKSITCIDQSTDARKSTLWVEENPKDLAARLYGKDAKNVSVIIKKDRNKNREVIQGTFTEGKFVETVSDFPVITKEEKEELYNEGKGINYMAKPDETVITKSQILKINKDDIYSSRDARVPPALALVYKKVKYEISTCNIVDAKEKTIDFTWEKGSYNVLCFTKGILKDPNVKFPLQITLTKK